jgi:hypothetical protein
MKFRRYRGRGFQGWIREDFLPPDLVLEAPERLSELPSAVRLLNCEGRQIYRLPAIVGGVPESCFVYYFTNASLQRGFRRCYALRCWRKALRLQARGFNTIDVLAALKRRRELLNWRSVLVAREVADVCELPSRGDHVFRIHPFIGFSGPVAEAFGRHLGRFHRDGFVHGDLKTRHVLVRNFATSRPDFFLVDLEKCVRLSFLPESLRVLWLARDLIQFRVSLDHCCAPVPQEAWTSFFESYLQEAGLAARNRRRIKRILRLYGPEGGFRQGRTLLANLLSPSDRRD